MTKNEKRINEYIKGIDLAFLEWVKLNSKELEEFLRKNYFDKAEQEYVRDDIERDVPLGLHYLSFDFLNNDHSFLLGIVSNNVGKKTIVSAIIFLENEHLFKEQQNPITYISSIEVNRYFRNQGIYKRMCEIFTYFVNPDQHVVISKESEMGEKCKVFDTLKAALEREGFQGEVLMDSCSYSSDFYDTICGKQYKLQK